MEMRPRFGFPSVCNKVARLAQCVVLAWLLAVTVQVAMAQVDAGAVVGTVHDSSSGTVAGAKITLVNTDTGIKQQTTTNQRGEYTFDPVKIGRYSVTAEMPGFEKVQQENVVITVQQHAQVNLTLSPGQVSETVMVTSEVPQLQTQDAAVGQTIQAQTINDLPLNGRNFTFLAQLSAGVTQDQNDGRGLGASGAFTANGLRPSQNNYLLDGIDNNSNLVDFLNGTSYAVLPPVDAIQEFRTQTSDYSAELGRGAGAVLNATVKSGSNQFHGDVWEFLRNDKLDAANFFENSGGLAKGEYRQNQFGFTLGGPIKRDKTFFFMDYQGTRIRQALTSVNTVPTMEERNSNYTDLSQLLTQSGTRTDVSGATYNIGQVFDPSTTRAYGSSGYIRSPFANNQIPASRIDPNAIKLLNLYPEPNESGLFNNYVSDRILSNDTDQFDVRGDHNFSEKDTLFARVTYVRNPQFIPGPFAGIADGGGFGSGDQNSISWNGVLSETHTFSPSMVNEARIGVNRIASGRTQPNATTYGIPAEFGIGGVSQATDNGGLPTINLEGLSQLGSSGYLPSIETSTVGQFSDVWTKIVHSQTLKAGFTYQRLRFAVLQPPAARGDFYFDGNYTEVPNTTGGNTGLAQLLLSPTLSSVGGTNYLGGPDYVIASNYANTDSQRNYNALFFQDDWKVTSKLTLNLGVRWEYFGPLVERYGAQSNFQPLPTGGATYLITQKRCDTQLNPDFITLAATDGVKIACSSQPGLQQVQKLNFSPRIGFAYQVMPKLVVRGGYGIFYGGFENSSQYNWGSFPFQFHINYSNTVPNEPIIYPNGAYASIEEGLSGIDLTPASVSPYGISFQGEDYKIHTPYTQSYNFTVQYQLASHDSIQAGYVGNTVRHLGVYVNQNTPQLVLPPAANSLTYSPFPDFAAYDNYTHFEGNSFYDGLQITYEHRTSFGLSGLANYTWSQCRTDATDLLNETNYGYRAPTLTGFGIQGDYQLCNYDIKNVFHFSGTYDIPVGHGRQFLHDSHPIVDGVLGGWSTNFILTLQGGQPGTIGCPVTTASGLGCIALLVPGQSVYASNKGPNDWLNAAAFATPAYATTIGQTDYAPLGGGPTQFYGPGFHRLDFSVFKTFPITERMKLEFRSEFFNLTNTPNFANPAYTDYTNASTFGQITATRDGQNDQREIQFALKLYF